MQTKETFSLEKTAGRLWKRLPFTDRLIAAAAFWKEPPQELVGQALTAIVKVHHLRPQVARSLPKETQARHLASVLEPGETLAQALLVALHLGERRPMLSLFLDAVGLPHENGVLKEEADTLPPVTKEATHKGIEALRQTFSYASVEAYLNTLWLQDPERWVVLASLQE